MSWLRLHLQDFRAEIGEKHGREWALLVAREIEDADACERCCHAPEFTRCDGWRSRGSEERVFTGLSPLSPQGPQLRPLR